jgi:YidC/Oxa1 family membrane protein insertase
VGNDSRRILIATALAGAIMVLWTVMAPPPAKSPAGPAAPTGAPAASGPAAAAAAPVPAPAPVPEAPEELVPLEGDGFRVVLSTRGGALRHVELLGAKYQREVEGKTVPIDLVSTAPGLPLPLSLAASPELGGPSDPLADPSARGSMRVAAREGKQVVFEGRVGAAGVRKTYRLTGKPYEVELAVEVSGAPAVGAVLLLHTGFMPPSTSSGSIFSGPPLDFVRPACRAKGSTERFDVAGDEVRKVLGGTVEWAAIDQHYFTSALLPSQPAEGCTFLKGAEKGAGAVAVPLAVTPAGARASYLLFAGPKQLELLTPYGRGFESAIDYGPVSNFFALFAQWLLWILRWFHAVAGNWGVAIILLTVTVKVALYPLTVKSMRSMGAMRKLQPEIDKLKAKHGDDKEKLNLAVMQLYQQNKVNPLGGCLPMLLQMPIWFALYAALQTSVELYRAPFLWMGDLTVKDPFFILPIAMGITSFIMQKISPQPADNTQAKMMLYFFPGFFTVMMLFVPSGLTLYIFVNNLLSIVQQQLVNRMQEREQPAKA